MPARSVLREKRILAYLHEHEGASIHELADEFGVSRMTIHRDLNRLALDGKILKRHGGAILVSEKAAVCAVCGKPVPERTVFILKLENGDERRACCAHCGLMLQSRELRVWQSLTADFLHGHMISAGQAYYLGGSDLNVCCVPSVLTFGSRQDAEKFQKGFGGRIFGMDEAVRYMDELIHAPAGA